MILVGEPYWVRVPASDDPRTGVPCPRPWRVVDASRAGRLLARPWTGPGAEDARKPRRLGRLPRPAVVDLRRWLDANPQDELWTRLRAELDSLPTDHLVAREHLGWGVFALMAR